MTTLLCLLLTLFSPIIVGPSNDPTEAVLVSSQNSWEMLGRVTGYDFGDISFRSTGYSSKTFIVYYRLVGEKVLYRAEPLTFDGKRTGIFYSIITNPHYKTNQNRTSSYNYYIDDGNGTRYYCSL